MRLLLHALLIGCSSEPAAPPPAASAAGEEHPAETTPAAPELPSPLALTCPAPDRPLAASLWLPAMPGPSPAAVILVGAQPWNRDGDLPGSPWGHYRDLARAIATAGGAALLFDKGGTGETGGPPAELDQRVREAKAALACLRARPEVDPARITVVGHSIGSVVAAQALAGDHVPTLVLLSPVVDPEMLTPPPADRVVIVRGELDGGRDEDAGRLAVLGVKGRHVIVPGGDHLLFDATNGTPDPNDPATEISKVAANAVAEAVTGKM